MPDEAVARNTSETIRLRVQAVGIPLAIAGLGLLQFWLVQVKWPAQAPVNLTTELSVRDAGSSEAHVAAGGAGETRLQAIELEVTARNPSARTIYLLRNIWAAHGIKVDPNRKEGWLDLMEKQVNGPRRIVGGEHYAPKRPAPIAVGNVFPDDGLQPNETIVRSFVFYVEQGKYDYVEVDVFLPPTAAESAHHDGRPAIDVEWKLRPERQGYFPVVKLIRPDGTRQEASQDADLKDSGLQWSTSIRMLSLWRDASNTSRVEDSVQP